MDSQAVRTGIIMWVYTHRDATETNGGYGRIGSLFLFTIWVKVKLLWVKVCHFGWKLSSHWVNNRGIGMIVKGFIISKTIER